MSGRNICAWGGVGGGVALRVDLHVPSVRRGKKAKHTQTNGAEQEMVHQCDDRNTNDGEMVYKTMSETK